jgi:hypothetical protein
MDVLLEAVQSFVAAFVEFGIASEMAIFRGICVRCDLLLQHARTLESCYTIE